VAKVAVIGGGIAGLAAAHRLSRTHDVVVFEREATAGGKIRSQKIAGGFLFEWGPGGFLASAEAVQSLVDELDLRDVLTPREKKRRSGLSIGVAGCTRCPQNRPKRCG